MTRIAIVGSTQLFREALARMLAQCGYLVVSQGVEPDASPSASDVEAPVDVVLTEMPRRNRSTADWLRRIGSRFPDARVILLTGGGGGGNAEALEALAGGAHGYLRNNLSFETVRSVVDAVSHGQIVYPGELRLFLSQASAGPPSPDPATDAAAGANGHAHPEPAVAPRRRATDRMPSPRAEEPPEPPRPAPRPSVEGERDLSLRERQILGEIAQGHSNKVIAFRLQLSEATVKSHLKSLLRKLGFTNRTQAAIYALKNPGATRPSGPSNPPGPAGRR